MIKPNDLNSYNAHIPNLNYTLTSKKTCDNLDKHNMYGIKLSSPHKIILHDISTCKETVLHMIKLFNKYQLSPIHIKDVVEDMIS